MTRSHNKKRNVGIIYEQLISYASESLVEGRKKDANNALSIIKSNFKKDSELYKEFRLFNALVKTSVPSSALATRIISEAKKAAENHDDKKLRSEKSQLIKDINHTLSEGSSLYSRKIKDYRTYATIQTLLNDWRCSNKIDFTRTTMYESKVHDWLLKEKEELILENCKTDNVDKLTVKIMTEKFNNRYKDTLNEDQKQILSEYAFSPSSNSLSEKLEKIKCQTKKNVKIFSKNCSNKTLNQKIKSVATLIESVDSGDINDETVSKFLLISRLNDELKEAKDV